MAKKKSVIKRTARGNERKPSWKNIFLALTLFPLAAGILLIIAWALDWDVTGSLENQVYIGILFILISTTLSNLVQKNWLLFIGWLFLLIADLLFLLIVNPSFQLVAGVLAIVGGGVLMFRFFQQINQRSEQAK